MAWECRPAIPKPSASGPSPQAASAAASWSPRRWTDPVFVALNLHALPARPRTPAELHQWVRRDEQIPPTGGAGHGCRCPLIPPHRRALDAGGQLVTHPIGVLHPVLLPRITPTTCANDVPLVTAAYRSVPMGCGPSGPSLARRQGGPVPYALDLIDAPVLGDQGWIGQPDRAMRRSHPCVSGQAVSRSCPDTTPRHGTKGFSSGTVPGRVSSPVGVEGHHCAVPAITAD
jgi:hypothetical protein